jgi:hypothetical protein
LLKIIDIIDKMVFQKYNFQKANFMSIPQQKIMFIMFYNSSKINYREQTIYKKEQSFIKAMRNLCKQKCIKEIKGKDFFTDFELTVNGCYYVKHVILS